MSVVARIGGGGRIGPFPSCSAVRTCLGEFNRSSQHLESEELRWERASVDDVECATLDWVSWFNEQRLLGPIGDIPPAEFEQMYYQQQQSRLDEAGLN